MEIVIENASPSSSSPSYPQGRGCRGVYAPAESASLEHYGRARSRLPSPEPDFDSPMPTSVRRVDRLGLLEIADPEPQRHPRPRHLTGAESHSATLTRRVDRSGLLEAVPELPDHCPSGWRTPEKSAQPPRNDRPDAHEPPAPETALRSPQVRRYAEPATGATVAPPARTRSYVDLTGATYTRSPPDELGDKPDCIGDRQVGMSAIPDVIEAHGSRVEAPEGQRAEAEGCERSATDGHEENSRGAKGAGKILHNENIQTLRVIILSEQL